MSRAFTSEDAEAPEPHGSYALPDPQDPGYEAAAADALLEGARVDDTTGAEAATGYRWGDPALAPHVRRALEREQAKPEEDQDRRLIQVARRFLRASGGE